VSQHKRLQLVSSSPQKPQVMHSTLCLMNVLIPIVTQTLGYHIQITDIYKLCSVIVNNW